MYTSSPWQKTALATDAGLRSHMLRIYNYMCSGVLVSAIVSLLTLYSGLTQYLFVQGPRGLHSTALGFIAAFAPLAFVLVLQFGINKLSTGMAQLLFWLYAASIGVSLSTLMLQYTGTSITRVFFISAATFAGMSLYGYTTNRNLTGWGSFLFMGLIGIIIASIVNIFLVSSMMQFIISIIGVGIFVGLTAYDTQRIKSNYYNYGSDAKMAVYDALSLYLDFLNMFLMMLRLFGDRRN